MSEIVVREATEVNVMVNRALARNRLADLRKLYRKHIDWQIMVRDHLDGLLPEAPPLHKMPSKALKGQMYDIANWFLRHYGITVPRPQNLAGVAAVVTAAEIRLAGLDTDVIDAE